AKYVEQLHGDEMPNLVLGVSHFSFHSGQSGWIKQDKRTRAFIGADPLRERIKPYTGLASLKLVTSSLKVLRGRYDASKREGDAGVDGSASDYRKIDKQGYLLREYPEDPETVAKITASHVGRYGRTFTKWVESGGRLAEDQRTALEATIKLANRHGHVPVVVLTQLNPVAREQLAGTGLEQQERAVSRYIEELGQRVDFTLLDMRSADAFGSTAADFYDATHMSTQAAARVIDLIAREADL
ncbi:MAG: hypothetical protein ABI200_06260, partial [Gaiellales bacterium]